jgi:hypothetical protein
MESIDITKPGGPGSGFHIEGFPAWFGIAHFWVSLRTISVLAD